MQLIVIVLSSVSIFLSFLFKKNLNSVSSEKIAFLVFCYVFGPVSNIVATYDSVASEDILLIVSSVCQLLSIFFLFFKSPSKLMINIGKSLLLTTYATTFYVSFVNNNSHLMKVSQIFSYIALYYVFVFNPFF